MKYLTHKNIDRNKWDALLAQIPHVHFYFLYDYLTTICKWDAIVLERDNIYELILPIPFKKKLWIKYFYQPFFCQQLGILSKKAVKQEDLSEIKKILKKEFTFGLAYWRNLESVNEPFTTNERINYEISLSQDFETVQHNFNSNRKRVLKKLIKNNYAIKKSTSSDAILKTTQRFSEIFKVTIPELKLKHYQNLYLALKKISLTSNVYVYDVMNERGIQSSGLFVEFQDRIVYLMGYTENNYRKEAVQSLIFHDLIKEEASSYKVLDLEGGQSDGIARFYKSLGGKIVPYREIAINSKHILFRKIFR